MCFMSNIDTLYEFKGLTDNIIASPCEVMGDGFPYSEILFSLFADDGMNFDLEGVCELYYEDYCDRTIYASATVALCHTSELDGLAAVVRQINETGIYDVDIDDLQCYERLSSNVFCDLGHYISEASIDLDLLAEFETIMDRAFTARYHTSSFYSALSGASGWVSIDSDHYSGVSTSEPSEKFQTEWSQTSWAEATTPTSKE